MKKKKAGPPENNPFADEFFDWMDSHDGALSMEVMDAVSALLENADVNAQDRKLIWEDGKRLSIDESVQCIHADFPQFSVELIEEHVIAWLEMEYAPEHYSQQQLDELDRLTEKWVDDHEHGRTCS